MDTMEQQSESTTNPPLYAVSVVRMAEQELIGLMEERARIIQRIGTIKQVLGGLADLFGNSVRGEPERKAPGRGVPEGSQEFTRACRRVLMDANAPMSAHSLSQEIRRRFPEIAARQKHRWTSVITAVLLGFVYDGEARLLSDYKGRRTWKWASDQAAGREQEFSTKEGSGAPSTS